MPGLAIWPLKSFITAILAPLMEGIKEDEYGLSFSCCMLNVTTGDGFGSDVDAEDFDGGIAGKE